MTALLAIGFVVGTLLLIQQLNETPTRPLPTPAAVEEQPPPVEEPPVEEPPVEEPEPVEQVPELAKPEVPEVGPVERPVPRPTAEATAPVEPPAPQRGTVVVEGDVDGLVLIGEAGEFQPGAVPAGTYSAQARFGERSVSLPGVVVLGGGTTILRCDRTFGRCRVE